MNLHVIKQFRQKLLTIFSRGLVAVDGRSCVFSHLQDNPLPERGIRVVAVGKAAPSMMQGVISYLESLDKQQQLLAGLVITKQGYAGCFADKRIEVLESDHPLPSERSLIAGQRLLDFVGRAATEDLLLFLISGGTSALVEVLPENITIEQLIKLNRWLLANPWSIDRINLIRQSVSCIKGGKLLAYLNTEHCIQLTISDVAGNDLSVIGSGLLVKPDKNISHSSIVLPDWVRQMQQSVRQQKKLSPPCAVQQSIVADNATAREAIKNYASKNGLQVIRSEELYGDVGTVSDKIARAITQGPVGLYIWGGEAVVDLPEQPGRGGRCQSMALLLAEKLKGRDDFVLLAAGTDGSDGPGDAAGALIDGMTIERGRQIGLDSSKEIMHANAGYYLAETGDLIDTGPTGTNVMDLVIAVKLSPTLA